MKWKRKTHIKKNATKEKNQPYTEKANFQV